MSRFYGTVEGIAKTPASRRGHKNLEAHIRGWNVGVNIECGVDEDGNDIIKVYKTGGSNSPSGQLIAILKEEGVIINEDKVG